MTTDGNAPQSDNSRLNSANGALPGATPVLILLLTINLFNFLDRQVLAAVEPELSKDVLGHLPLRRDVQLWDYLREKFPEKKDKSFWKRIQKKAPENEEQFWKYLRGHFPDVNDEQSWQEIKHYAPREGEGFWSGSLASAFLLTYIFMAPLFGWLGDHVRRWLLVALGVIIWSLASGASGLDWMLLLSVNAVLAYWILWFTRCMVGFGEAAYGPIAPSMLADLYPVRHRGRIMAWFYAAIPVGGALGYTLGDLMLTKNGGPGWRWAFYVVVPPGLLLGLICFLMREPPRGQAEGVAGLSIRKANLRDYLDLTRIPSYMINLVGMTCLMFAIGAISYWMPRFLAIRKAPPLAGIPPGALFGLLIAVGGLAATFLGGIAGDRLRRFHSGSYFIVSGAAMILGFPMVLLAIWMPFPWAWLFIFLAGFSLFFNTAPTNAINANVTHPSVRASAFAFNILITHLLGDVISPPLIGLVRDFTSLEVGFAVVSTLMLVGGAFWIWGSIFLQRDTDQAPMRLRGDTG